MNTTIELVETSVQERLTAAIRKIASSEEFKLEAYFFCGFPSGTPNEKLLKACKSYLETVDNAQPDAAVTAALLSELEAAVSAKSVGAAITNIDSNLDDMKEILEHRDLLLQ